MDAEIKGQAGAGVRIAAQGFEVSAWLLSMAEPDGYWLLGYTSSDYEAGAVIELRESLARRPEAGTGWPGMAPALHRALYDFEGVTAEHRDAAHILDVLARWLVDGYIVAGGERATARIGIKIERGLKWSVRLLGNGGLVIDPAARAA